ncbi:MAG: Xaa-Pro peptidase family protein [Chloroflexota bacterium]|nr:Xaa-Pro peptidase family protein [Chloroflexota bacterium]
MEPRPSREEIRRRLASVAGKAQGEGIDVLIVVDPANVYYLSGFRTTLHTRFTAVVLRAAEPGSATLVAPSVDRLLALEPHWYPSLLDQTEIYYEGAPLGGPLPPDPFTFTDAFVRDGDVIGVDLEGALYSQVQSVMTRYPSAQLRDTTGILHAARRVKSPWELEVLRRANAIAVGALSQVPGWLREGMTEVELASRLDAAAREGGSDGFAYPTLIGFGQKSLAPHAAPTARRLERDQIVTIAFGPSLAGYCADIVRTFFFGTPPPVALEVSRNTVSIQEAALEAVRPGARAGETMTAANRLIGQLYPDAPRAGRAGHSLGLTIHETPSLTPDNDTLLEPNMVLAIEPRPPAAAMAEIGLYRHCDVIRVTEDGYELLSPLERGLLVVRASGA